jgi:hypothetical protein
MTKPIEGWVGISADGEVSVYTDIEDPRSDHIAIYLRKQPGLDYRPVRITFTDEAVINEQADMGMAFVAGVASQTSAIAEAVREDRERIWGMVKIIEGKHYENPEPIEEDFVFEWTTYGDIKRVIFGEEK